MHQEQHNNLNMLESTVLTLIDYKNVWNNHPAIANVISEFKTHLSMLLAANQLKKPNVFDFSRRKNVENIKLFAELFDVSREEIEFEIEDINLGALIDMEEQVLRISTNIDLHMRIIKALLNEQLDPLILKFKSNYASFYNQYMAARFVPGFEHKKTGILKGFIYNEYAETLSDALIILTGKASVQEFTNESGAYCFGRLSPGTYTITVSLTGYIKQKKVIQITESSKTKIDFVMESILSLINNNTKVSMVKKFNGKKMKIKEFDNI